MSGSPSISSLRALLIEQSLHLWRHKWKAVAACWIVCLLGWGAVMTMPRQYTSDARAYIDVNGLLAPLLRGLVIDTDGGQTAEYLRQTLLSRPNLDQVVRLAELDRGLSPTERDALIANLAASIRVTSQGRNLVSIAYSNSDPIVAKNVVTSLLTLFSEKSAGSTRVAMEGAQKFLDQQIASYEEQLRAAERRRADFRKQYAAYLSDASGMPRVYSLEQQVVAARQQYSAAVLARDSLATQLRQVPQFVSVDSAPAVSADGRLVTASPSVRLAQAQQVLAQLQLRYTDLHPDVIAAKREVADLQQQVLRSASGAQPATEGTTRISNPVYEEIRLKLVDAQTAIPAAQQKLNQAIADLDHVKAISAEMPDIDAKASDLDRDYEIIKKNHDELVTRREAATLSQAADDQADRTQFRVVDPPLLPVSPSSPNLPLMFSLVLLLGIGAGGALPVLIERVRGTFTSASQLRDFGLPVIGCVTYAAKGWDRRTALTQGAAIGFAALMLLGVYSALLTLGAGANGGLL